MSEPEDIQMDRGIPSTYIINHIAFSQPRSDHNTSVERRLRRAPQNYISDGSDIWHRDGKELATLLGRFEGGPQSAHRTSRDPSLG